MEEKQKEAEIKMFTIEEACIDAVYACRRCFTDFFLETNILHYVETDDAYFVKQRESINFSAGRHTKIHCANCKLQIGYVVYHWDYKDNEIRFDRVVPKYLFR